MKMSFTHPLHLVLGLIIWAVWFVSIYSGLSVACVVAPPDLTQGPLTWINAVLLVFTLITTAGLLLLALRSFRQPTREETPPSQRFITRLAATVYLAASIGTLAVGLPVIVLPPCV